MRIVTLNIQHGGGTRVGAIVAWLVAQAADVVVLSEYRAGPKGDALRASLAEAGYRQQFPGRADAGVNSVLVAARSVARAIRPEVASVDAGRIVITEIEGIRIAGVYFNLGKDKASLFDYLLARPPSLEPSAIVIGDMNTGRHDVDEAGATFHCSERFERLVARGYTDLWRLCHGEEAREYSWYSPRHRNGFRVDHAFGTGDVPARVAACAYDQTTRDGLSDHAAMIVELSS